ncbi:hypothetical protein [Enterobacter sp. FB]|uniref:hypothetical protein n=1 Tax=Enterobacter sp. FB TaxID=1571816 RepID=UPI0012FECC6C|nr:hypothetical protein [Enterobacter sp. FB]
MAQQRLQREIGLVEIGNTGMTVKVESCGCSSHHRQINKPRDGHGDRHVPLGGGVTFFTRPTVEMLSQRGVQIDHVRHDGRPQHPGGQEHRFGGRQAWDRHPFTELRQIRL